MGDLPWRSFEGLDLQAPADRRQQVEAGGKKQDRPRDGEAAGYGPTHCHQQR
jgi:hypothetical protein